MGRGMRRPVAWFDGVEWDEGYVMKRFNEDLLPFIRKHGSLMGDCAMKGDLKAERVIQRYKQFSDTRDPLNLMNLTNELKAWQKEQGL